MPWVEPKTDWVATDFFNLTPDYDRIKGNILYIQELAASLQNQIELQEMEEYTIADIPYVEFFNTIVENVRALEAQLYTVEDMVTYVANGSIWSANELNIIERNLLRLYTMLQGEINLLGKLEFMLGVDEI